MSNVWHTVDETPKPYEDVAFYVDGYLYFSSYEPQYNQYGIFGADKVEKWCYSKELSSYILALETELERTRKALDVAVDTLERLDKELYFNNAKQTGHIADSVAQIPGIALDQITALEQKDHFADVSKKVEQKD